MHEVQLFHCHLAAALPAQPRAALLHASKLGFTDALTTILLIGAAIALIGALLAFALVRSRDFVASGQPQAEPAAEPVGAAA